MSSNKANDSGTVGDSKVENIKVPIRDTLIEAFHLDEEQLKLLDLIITTQLIGEEVSRSELEAIHWFPKLWTASERINWVHNYNMILRRMRIRYRGTNGR